MHTMIESITPTLAKAYLEKNTNNRPLNLSHVKYLAASMSSGQWRITHESIAFDQDDKLIDGQHRLSAVVSSGATVQISVTRGCDSSTFAVINDGQRRSASDALSIAGEKNAARLAAIVAVAIRGAETSLNKRAVSRQTVCEFLTSRHGNLARNRKPRRPRNAAHSVRWIRRRSSRNLERRIAPARRAGRDRSVAKHSFYEQGRSDARAAHCLRKHEGKQRQAISLRGASVARSGAENRGQISARG
jgi:hypothetical protein